VADVSIQLAKPSGMISKMAIAHGVGKLGINGHRIASVQSKQSPILRAKYLRSRTTAGEANEIQKYFWGDPLRKRGYLFRISYR